MSNFGYEIAGSDPNGGVDYLWGTKGTPASDGILTAIKVHIHSVNTVNTCKCGLYKVSDLSKIAETEEKNLVVGDVDTWVNFAATGTPAIVGGTAYYLIFWNGAQTVQIHYNAGFSDGDAIYKAQAYGAYPNPMGAPNTQSVKYSIYGVYTVAGYVNKIFGVTPVKIYNVAPTKIYGV